MTGLIALVDLEDLHCAFGLMIEARHNSCARHLKDVGDGEGGVQSDVGALTPGEGLRCHVVITVESVLALHPQGGHVPHTIVSRTRWGSSVQTTRVMSSPTLLE